MFPFNIQNEPMFNSIMSKRMSRFEDMQKIRNQLFKSTRIRMGK